MRLLFDLDGTLTDSAPGITRCLQHALGCLGRPSPEESALRAFIGPPLRHTFTTLLPGDDVALVDQALILYRERFRAVGMFENSVYPGVREGVDGLRAAGHALCVVTSKPYVYARQILEHFHLLGMFTAVYGPELGDENGDKTTLIARALAAEGSAAAMVGDRRHDVEGARANGLLAIGVLWGYGTRAELENAGAEVLVASMPELTQWVSS
jgi:phosphoglycolate phosphatase